MSEPEVTREEATKIAGLYERRPGEGDVMECRLARTLLALYDRMDGLPEIAGAIMTAQQRLLVDGSVLLVRDERGSIVISDMTGYVIVSKVEQAVVRTDDRYLATCFHCDPPRTFAVTVGTTVDPTDPVLHDGHAHDLGPVPDGMLPPYAERVAMRECIVRLRDGWRPGRSQGEWEHTEPGYLPEPMTAEQVAVMS